MLVDNVKDFYSTLNIELKARLSFRDDSDKYLGDMNLWTNAQAILKNILDKSGIEYYVGVGEAAFYGPKIDFMGSDAQGRELQLATPQLDFVQPERFGLKYTDEDGQEKTPVMIHFALMGSIERFLAAYIETSKGRFPVWLAPEQIRIISVNQEQSTTDFVESVLGKANALGLRCEIDNSNESVGKKIRSSEMMKIPYTIVIGAKEIESQQVTPRIRNDLKSNENDVTLSIDDFFVQVSTENKKRSKQSTSL